ncbi:glycosyltransferase family 2 protein [Kiloniella sp.]|uniref:glycosyltransferase family 2 protein n=1 Tax=Kiloniella sp. TaxID=1938587 RepID=UPI003B026DB5
MTSSTTPLLTIALPVYNGGNTLRVAVQSILDQTFTDWELYIIDDGSSDGAVEALPQSSDPRIHVLRDGNNKGLSSRLNEAVQMAQGTYFARMDHDDICHPERFSKQITYLKSNHDVDLLGAFCITINEQSQIVGTLPTAITHEQICKKPWLGFYLPHPTWCGKIEWFRANSYKHNPAPYCCEDQELLLRAYSTSRYHALPMNLLAYRVRTNTPMKRLWRNRWAWCKEQVNYFKAHQKKRLIALTCLAAIARISNDLMKKFLFAIRRKAPQKNSHRVSATEYDFWETRIADLE